MYSWLLYWRLRKTMVKAAPVTAMNACCCVALFDGPSFPVRIRVTNSVLTLALELSS